MNKAFVCLAAMVVAGATQAQPPAPQSTVPPSPAVLWSEDATTTAPKSGDQFQGPFMAQPVTVTVKQLPGHAWVRLKFKLYVVGSWDGSSRVWGPDLWSLQVRGAQRLCFASFGNMGEVVNNNVQSYPDEYPWGRHPAGTGASARNALGFTANGAPTTAAKLNDAVYPMEMVFPHDTESLVLDFAGIYNDPPQERQSWGIGGLEIEPLDQPPAVSDEELSELWWDKLGSDDPVQAYEALWKMVAASDRAVSFIKDRVLELGAELAQAKRSTPPVTGLEALRLHRAHRILRLIGKDQGGTGFKIDHMIPEYFSDLDL